MARVARIERHGGPEVIRWVDVDLPDPGAGEVRIRTTAVGLNFIEVYQRTGLYPMTLPSGLGGESVGVIEAVGPGVAGYAVGERVGTFGPAIGSYATHRNLPADSLFHLPDAVDDVTAAAILLKGATTEFLIERCAKVQPGWTVLVHAAAGGVGQLLVQMAKRRDATVIALASTPEKAALAVARGAEHGLTYEEDWVATVRQLTAGGVDIAYDSVGTTLADSLAATRPRGTVVAYGTAGGDPPAIDPRQLMEQSKAVVGGDLWDHLDSREGRLARAAALFAALRAGEIALPEIEVFPLSRGADAHRRLESRGVTGKIVLVPDEVA